MGKVREYPYELSASKIYGEKLLNAFGEDLRSANIVHPNGDIVANGFFDTDQKNTMVLERKLAGVGEHKITFDMKKAIKYFQKHPVNADAAMTAGELMDTIMANSGYKREAEARDALVAMADQNIVDKLVEKITPKVNEYIHISRKAYADTWNYKPGPILSLIEAIGKIAKSERSREINFTEAKKLLRGVVEGYKRHDYRFEFTRSVTMLYYFSERALEAIEQGSVFHGARDSARQPLADEASASRQGRDRAMTAIPQIEPVKISAAKGVLTRLRYPDDEISLAQSYASGENPLEILRKLTSKGYSEQAAQWFLDAFVLAAIYGLNDSDVRYLREHIASIVPYLSRLPGGTLQGDEKKQSKIQDTAIELSNMWERFGIGVVSDSTRKDFTMTAKEVTPGGIDLNTSSGMQWKISKDGKGVEMNIDPAMIERFKREGINSLSPVIFRITPITSVWPLVGMEPPKKEPAMVVLN
ncbi:MAG: hypothetical protein HY209_07745 [Candidatus Omnitrophica bacterium]|nr:hypothetical protein [Candidatus Omnitrophota bacterium]